MQSKAGRYGQFRYHDNFERISSIFSEVLVKSKIPVQNHTLKSELELKHNTQGRQDNRDCHRSVSPAD